jgi:hypothetical protein
MYRPVTPDITAMHAGVLSPTKAPMSLAGIANTIRFEECRPSISSGGTHGYCGQNPYWRPEPTNSGAPTGSVGAPTGSSAAPTGSKVAR